ncbi:hypothetical protein PR048_012467 [Dryococelus australis]|uniref:Uncharacterized protein n=1 Tax=Dryococelus australis TaxID=614101 RepID=A0ABQ9HPH4_9NEOP|nr:hypothetical protein PR048_012467 [Dryococelus australis]
MLLWMTLNKVVAFVKVVVSLAGTTLLLGGYLTLEGPHGCLQLGMVESHSRFVKPSAVKNIDLLKVNHRNEANLKQTSDLIVGCATQIIVAILTEQEKETFFQLSINTTYLLSEILKKAQVAQMDTIERADFIFDLFPIVLPVKSGESRDVAVDELQKQFISLQREDRRESPKSCWLFSWCQTATLSSLSCRTIQNISVLKSTSPVCYNGSYSEDFLRSAKRAEPKHTQQDVKKWQMKQAEQARQVKLNPSDWVNNPDREVADLPTLGDLVGHFYAKEF